MCHWKGDETVGRRTAAEDPAGGVDGSAVRHELFEVVAQVALDHVCRVAAFGTGYDGAVNQC